MCFLLSLFQVYQGPDGGIACYTGLIFLHVAGVLNLVKITTV